jgi:hypothetical protein
VTSKAVVGSCDQQRRLQHQGHRDHDALPLAARELVWVGVRYQLGLGQAHMAHDRERALRPRGGRQAGMGAQHLVDLLAAGHHRIERRHRLLEDHRHACAA